MHYPEDHDARVAESGVAPHAARCPPRAIDLVDDLACRRVARPARRAGGEPREDDRRARRQARRRGRDRGRRTARGGAEGDVGDGDERAGVRGGIVHAGGVRSRRVRARVGRNLRRRALRARARVRLPRRLEPRVRRQGARGSARGEGPAETKPDPDAPPTAMVGLVAAARSATRAPDDAFRADARDRLFDAAVGALGVLFVDKRARDAYLAVDPGFETLASACAGSSLGSDGSDDAENRRKVAAEAMSSALVRDADARRKLIKAGGFERLANLAKDSDHVGVKLAAARAMSSYASSGPRGEKALARMKKLEKALAIASDAVEWTARELLGPPAPSPQEAKEADDAFEAVAQRRAALERAVAEREAADAAAKTDAETRMVAWEPPPPPEEAAELRRLNETTAAENAAKALEAEEAAARSAKIVGRDALPETLSALSFAVAGLLRASFGKKNAAAESADNSAAAERSSGAGFAMSDSEMLKTLARVRATADAHRAGTLDERNVASALGCVSAMALDREHCARLVDAGAPPRRPRRSPPRGSTRRIGRSRRARPRGVPAPDADGNRCGTADERDRDDRGDPARRVAHERRARRRAASLGLVLEHPAATRAGRFHLRIAQRRTAERTASARDSSTTSSRRSAAARATRAPRRRSARLRRARCSCARAARASRRRVRRRLGKGDFAGGAAPRASPRSAQAASGPRSHVSAQFLAAALWCAARARAGARRFSRSAPTRSPRSPPYDGDARTRGARRGGGGGIGGLRNAREARGAVRQGARVHARDALAPVLRRERTRARARGGVRAERVRRAVDDGAVPHAVARGRARHLGRLRRSRRGGNDGRLCVFSERDRGHPGAPRRARGGGPGARAPRDARGGPRDRRRRRGPARSRARGGDAMARRGTRGGKRQSGARRGGSRRRDGGGSDAPRDRGRADRGGEPPAVTGHRRRAAPRGRLGVERVRAVAGASARFHTRRVVRRARAVREPRAVRHVRVNDARGVGDGGAGDGVRGRRRRGRRRRAAAAPRARRRAGRRRSARGARGFSRASPAREGGTSWRIC